MGCGASDVIDTSANNVSMLLRKEIKKLIKGNPFYKFSIDEMMILLPKPTTPIPNVNLLMQNTLSNIIIKLNMDTLQASLITDVMSYAEKKLISVYPNTENYTNQLLLTIMLFLHKRNNESDKIMREMFEIIISKCIANKDTNKYHTGKLLFAIFNLIQFFLFAFVYFFLSIGILDIFTNIDYDGLCELFYVKQQWNNISPQNINEYIKNKLFLISPSLTPKRITDKLLYKCFEPMKEEVMMNSKEDKVVFTKEKVNEISSVMIEIANADRLVDLFFFGCADTSN